MKFNLIVAMCNNRGIGFKGHLPWPPLKKDMAFLAKVSTETKDQNKKNAVIMGRKTWFSIPEKRRPLKNRINIIISTTLKNLTEPDTYVVNNFENSLELIRKKQSEIEGIYIFGGSSVYQKALNSNYACRVYLTKVYENFECDVFLPEFENDDRFHYHQLKDTSHDTSILIDNDIKHQLFIYEKNPSFFSPVVAFIDKDRGFANNNNLPWPYIEKDHGFYTSLIGNVQEQGYKNVVIKGRVTYESARDEGKKTGVHTVVISSNLKETTDDVLAVVSSFEEALKVIKETPYIENIFILGGFQVYETALKHHLCEKIYLTRIFADYKCDRFFPIIDNRFQIESEKDEFDEKSGIKIRFEEYKRI